MSLDFTKLIDHLFGVGLFEQTNQSGKGLDEIEGGLVISGVRESASSRARTEGC